MKSKKYSQFLRDKKFVVKNKGFKVRYDDINEKLFDFQRDIVLWALKKGRSAIFADCGLGKTPIQLEWAHHIHKKTGRNVLIFAPLAVSKQTKREGSKFGRSVNICTSMDDVQDGINVTNYEKFHRFDLNKFAGIVLDESSILKSYTGKFRTQIIQETNNIHFKLACTATPAPNDYMELGNHSEFLGIMNRMEMLVMFFIHDSGKTQKWRLKGHAQSEFWKWLTEWAVMIRKPSDIGYDDGQFVLPTIHIHEHIIECAEPPDGEFFIREAQTLKERQEARRNTIKERAISASKIVNGSNEPWLIWCNLNDESSELVNSIKDAHEITGSNKDEYKENAMMAFSAQKISRLVTKPKIAGFGMNWQHCSNMIFVGLSDSYEQYYQAVRRCWRFGQKKEVNVHIIVSDSEGSVLANIKRKEDDAINMAKEMVENMIDLSKAKIKDHRNKKDKYMADVYNDEQFVIYKGDCCEEITKIDSESIDLSVFSPPFSSLYTYSDSNRDMGNSKNYEEFEMHFKYLIEELYRVMVPGRHVAVHCMNIPMSKQMFGDIQLRDFRGDIIRWFSDVGFFYHAEVCIWKDPVVAMQRTKALGLLWKQLKKDSSMSRMGLPDYVVVMRKPGDNPKPISHTADEFPVDRWQQWASPIWTDIKQSNTLNRLNAKESKDEKHICPLQLDVIERIIGLYSNQGDTVFSPFTGIGSELHQSIKMNRHAIGIELKTSYYDLAIKNCLLAKESVDVDDLFKCQA